MDKYAKVRVLGKGSFGSAILIKRKSDGALFVVKEVSLLKMSKKERDEARHECIVLQQLHHPNIVRYIEQFENRNNLYIVMEYCDGGDLAGKVKEARGPMKEAQVMYYFSQVCLAMEYLHSRHILHRDIKTMNVFLMKSGAVKLGDFGISTILRNTMGMANTVCGTPYYFSPELCRNKPYNNKSDIWALGVLLYECATGGRHPFDGNSMNQLMQRIVKGSYAPLSSQYSSEFRKMVDWCLQKDPHKRPSIKQTLALPLVRGSLEQLEENLMLATQCRVRLKDIIDFEAGVDGRSNNNDGKTTDEKPAKTAQRPLSPGLTPGQAAALAMAKQQQQQQQQPKPLLSPRSPGAAAAVVGPKPSANANDNHLVKQPQHGANHYSPYHQQIMKNLEKLRQQKRAPEAADRGAGAGGTPSVSPPLSPRSPAATPYAFAAAAGSPSASPKPPAPPLSPSRQQPQSESPAEVSRPTSPAASPSPRGGRNERAEGAARPSGQAPREGGGAAMQEGMERVDAIMAKYGHNVDEKAKETIHAYMRRKQEEYLRRQKEDNERRERRNELRQRELRRVLDRQRGVANGIADKPAGQQQQQKRKQPQRAPPPSSAARESDPNARSPQSPARNTKDDARPTTEEKLRQDGVPNKADVHPSPPAAPPGPGSPRRGYNQGPATPTPRSPSHPSPSRPQTPGKMEAPMPAHLRNNNRAGNKYPPIASKAAAFGRDPRAKAAVNDTNAARRAGKASPASAGSAAVRNPLRRVSTGAHAPTPSAREQLLVEQQQKRQERKRIMLAANSPQWLGGGGGEADELRAARANQSPSAAEREQHSRVAGPSDKANPQQVVGAALEVKKAAPTTEPAPRTDLVQARYAAAQELREKREKLRAASAVTPTGEGSGDSVDPPANVSPRKDGMPGDLWRDPTPRDRRAGDGNTAVGRLQQQQQRQRQQMQQLDHLVPPPAGPALWAERVAPQPALGLEAVGHRASPVPLVSPTRRKLGSAAPLSPVSVLPTRTTESSSRLTGNGNAAAAPPPPPLSPSSQSPRGGNLRSPAKRYKVAAGSDKRRSGALPPVSSTTPELIDVQYGVVGAADHRSGRDGSKNDKDREDDDGTSHTAAAATDPLRMLHKKKSLGGGGSGVAPSGGSADVPAVYLPTGGNEAGASPYNPTRHHLYRQHQSLVGDVDVYAGMQRRTDTSAEEAEGFLSPHGGRGEGNADVPVSAVPSMLEALRSLRETDPSLNEELATNKSGQLALLKQRQQKQRQEQSQQQQHQRQPSLPPRLTGEVDRFWENRKTPPLGNVAAKEIGASSGSRSPFSTPASPTPSQGRSAAAARDGAMGVPPPLQHIELRPVAGVDAPGGSPSERRNSTDGYAEMLQHLKDLLQKRKAGNARGGRSESPSGDPSSRGGTPVATKHFAPHESAESPPVFHHTKARVSNGGAGHSSSTGKDGAAEDEEAASDSLAVSSSNPDEETEALDDEDDDFEDAVPLSPVRHAELNDTYARMMANLTGNDADSDTDTDSDKAGGATAPLCGADADVYTNDVFLSDAKAEVEEDGEEGYTGYYKLPSPEGSPMLRP